MTVFCTNGHNYKDTISISSIQIQSQILEPSEKPAILTTTCRITLAIQIQSQILIFSKCLLNIPGPSSELVKAGGIITKSDIYKSYCA